MHGEEASCLWFRQDTASVSEDLQCKDTVVLGFFYILYHNPANVIFRLLAAISSHALTKTTGTSWVTDSSSAYC